MSWHPRSIMDVKREFLELALKEGANRRELCRRFGISPKTGYALLSRYAEQGWGACKSQSSKPHSSPLKTSAAMERQVIRLREQHPSWGGRKIARRLLDLGKEGVPRPSTITDILHRNGLITSDASLAAEHWTRFEHEAPNDLWQIDFKGSFKTSAGPCFPLTLLDDHSRFNLTLTACSGMGTELVQPVLQRVFQRYGMPRRINADNGAPWGSPRAGGGGLSHLTVWLVRMGVHVSHSSPYHPQTNGKLERFHRSLKAEVLSGRTYANLVEAQLAFEHWRDVYNLKRPHQAIEMQTPMSRYVASSRPWPSQLPPIEYGPDDVVLTVKGGGFIMFKGRRVRTSSALHRLPIAIRPDENHDGCYNLYFCHQRFMRLDLSDI